MKDLESKNSIVSHLNTDNKRRFAIKGNISKGVSLNWMMISIDYSDIPKVIG